MAGQPHGQTEHRKMVDELLGSETAFRAERQTYVPCLCPRLATGAGVSRILPGFDLEALKVAQEQLPFVSRNRLVEIVPAAARKEPRPPADDDKPTYVGVKACNRCHKKAVDFWSKTVHARAWTTLVDKNKQYNYDCTGCHATGWLRPGGSHLASVESAGLTAVQCEVCHGAGADYKSLAVMKDKAASIKAGMKAYPDKAAIEAQCKTCHNEKSPTAKAFNFDERWAKIQHAKKK